jgi:NAD(P)-dependent dehydrogenase (short-subunit alcohol dehydrogenase family)
MGQLDGKVALITGSGRGQGLAAAKLFAAEGAKVVVNDLDDGTVDEAVGSIRAAGGEATGATGDVSDSPAVQHVLATAKAAYGGLDILYNNAGIGFSATKRFGIEMSDIVSCTEEDWRRIIDINLGGVFLFCKYGIPLLIERGGGVIITTSSLGAVRGGPVAHAYTASKGAINALTRSLAVTYGPSGVRANAILPGVIDTEMIHEAMVEPPEVRDIVIAQTPLRRYGTADDIASMALFLASDHGRFVSGETILVDGGFAAG